MNAVSLGATSGIGRALAQQLAERGENLFLLGRHADELARSAADLQARHPSQRAVGHAPCDLERPEGFAAALDAAWKTLGDVDTVIVSAGLYGTQEALESDVELTRRLVTVNFANTVVFCEHARTRLLARGGGRLVVFSSVAGDRGRGPGAIYGASKAGLSVYLEGLDHRYHKDGLRVLCVKPGFVHTPMTAGLKPPPFASDPEHVARDVVRAIDEELPVLYTPRVWQAVMGGVKALPRFVMRRAKF